MDVPPRPEKPQLTAPHQGSSLGVALVVGFALIGGGAMLTLLLLTLGWVGPILVLGAIFAVGGFHYLVWGWWLGPLIHREVESEQRAAQELADSESREEQRRT